jgi:glycosidase
LQKRFAIMFQILFIYTFVQGQAPVVFKIEPPDWWVGMREGTLQLMIYGKDLKDIRVKCNSKTFIIDTSIEVTNHKYAFVDVRLDDKIKPGRYEIEISNQFGFTSVPYRLKERKSRAGLYQGFGTDDVIYLITPDRFANGDSTNDYMPEMLDKFDRLSPLGRHGGDIQGIIDKLDYLSALGITTLWINPLVENNMTISYHGYGATDLYRTDPRFGTNELYVRLVQEAHQRGLKIIMDHVSNHVGIHHPWIQDLPMPDWLNGSPANYQINRHGKDVLQDIHGDSVLALNTLHGWFVSEMPDLNQQNQFVSRYLIQNTLWWIESSGLDGIREDTYPYADQNYLTDWARTILSEYPGFNIVGEVWIQDPAFLSAYQQGSRLTDKEDTYLPCITDFGLFNALGNVFYREEGIGNIYRCLSYDFLYPDPYRLLTFIDNHDVLRLMDMVQGEVQKYKLALQLIVTLRGIPQVYYGTEIGLRGGKDHGLIRADFPGGFPGDPRNSFTQEGRTDVENDIYKFFTKLMQLRKNYPALRNGKMIHFPVQDEFYIYFRISGTEKILLVVNNKNQRRVINTNLFQHHLKSTTNLVDIEKDTVIPCLPGMSIEVEAYDMAMYKLQ